MTRQLSKRAQELIFKHEVGGGERYYSKFLSRPTWPGASSGVTIGIGFDIGQQPKEVFEAAWAPYLTADQFNRLAATHGVTGSRAKACLPSVRDIVIPWSVAVTVYNSAQAPHWIRATQTAFPGSDVLHDDAFGALVSLVMNRGTAMSGDSRREMRAIRELVPRNDRAGIAAQLRAMKRLWIGRGVDGLLNRREDEARLVETAGQHALTRAISTTARSLGSIIATMRNQLFGR